MRPYRAADRAALEAMYVDFEPKRVAQGLPPEGTEALRRWLDGVLPKGDHLVVEIAERIAGHGFLIAMRERTAELANFLHPSVWNRGIGTALNRSLVELARRRGYQRLWLSVEPWNKAALRSYEHAGFRRLPGSLWAPEIEMEIVLDGG